MGDKDQFVTLADGYPHTPELYEQRFHFVTSLYYRVKDVLLLDYDPSENSPSESLPSITSAKGMLDDVSLSSSEVSSFTK